MELAELLAEHAAAVEAEEMTRAYFPEMPGTAPGRTPEQIAADIKALTVRP